MNANLVRWIVRQSILFLYMFSYNLKANQHTLVLTNDFLSNDVTNLKLMKTCLKSRIRSSKSPIILFLKLYPKCFRTFCNFLELFTTYMDEKFFDIFILASPF